jgi:hypothetical protein
MAKDAIKRMPLQPGLVVMLLQHLQFVDQHSNFKIKMVNDEVFEV